MEGRASRTNREENFLNTKCFESPRRYGLSQVLWCTGKQRQKDLCEFRLAYTVAGEEWIVTEH